MKPTTIILGSILVLVAGVYVYTITRPAPSVPLGAKGTKKKGVFNNGIVGNPTYTNIAGAIFSNKNPNVPKSGVSANQPLLNVTNFLSGIFHPTNQNSDAGTATPTSDTTSTGTTS